MTSQEDVYAVNETDLTLTSNVTVTYCSPNQDWQQFQHEQDMKDFRELWLKARTEPRSFNVNSIEGRSKALKYLLVFLPGDLFLLIFNLAVVCHNERLEEVPFPYETEIVLCYRTDLLARYEWLEMVQSQTAITLQAVSSNFCLKCGEPCRLRLVGYMETMKCVSFGHVSETSSHFLQGPSRKRCTHPNGNFVCFPRFMQIMNGFCHNCCSTNSEFHQCALLAIGQNNF